MGDSLEKLCINSKGFPLFRFFLKLDDSLLPACSCTRFKANNEVEAVNYFSNTLCEKDCKFMQNIVYFCGDTHNCYLGCDYKKRKVSDIVNDG